MLKNAVRFERIPLKAVFSPDRQPKYHAILLKTLTEFQHRGEFHPDYDVSFSADCQGFRLSERKKLKKFVKKVQ